MRFPDFGIPPSERFTPACQMLQAEEVFCGGVIDWGESDCAFGHLAPQVLRLVQSPGFPCMRFPTLRCLVCEDIESGVRAETHGSEGRKSQKVSLSDALQN